MFFPLMPEEETALADFYISSSFFFQPFICLQFKSFTGYIHNRPSSTSLHSTSAGFFFLRRNQPQHLFFLQHTKTPTKSKQLFSITLKMARQRSAGRSAPARPSVPSRAAPPKAQQTRPATTYAPAQGSAQHAAPTSAAQAPATASQGPGLFGQMASTAA